MGIWAVVMSTSMLMAWLSMAFLQHFKMMEMTTRQPEQATNIRNGRLRIRRIRACTIIMMIEGAKAKKAVSFAPECCGQPYLQRSWNKHAKMAIAASQLLHRATASAASSAHEGLD